MEPLFRTSYLGARLTVYPDHISYKALLAKEKTIPLSQIISVVGTPLLAQVTIELTGARKYTVPVIPSEKKKLCTAIMDAKATQAKMEPRTEEADAAKSPLMCPKCGSAQITAQKRGFSFGRALVGGVVGGLIGRGNIVITCLACGNRFKPGSTSAL